MKHSFHRLKHQIKKNIQKTVNKKPSKNKKDKKNKKNSLFSLLSMRTLFAPIAQLCKKKPHTPAHRKHAKRSTPGEVDRDIPHSHTQKNPKKTLQNKEKKIQENNRHTPKKLSAKRTSTASKKEK